MNYIFLLWKSNCSHSFFQVYCLAEQNCSKDILTITTILLGLRHAYIERSLLYDASTQLARGGGGGGEASPAQFWKLKSVPVFFDLWKYFLNTREIIQILIAVVFYQTPEEVITLLFLLWWQHNGIFIVYFWVFLFCKERKKSCNETSVMNMWFVNENVWSVNEKRMPTLERKHDNLRWTASAPG